MKLTTTTATAVRTLALAALAASTVAAPPAAQAFHGYYYQHGYPYHGWRYHGRHHAFRAPGRGPGRAVPDRPVPDRSGRAAVATRMSPSFARLDVGRGGFGPARNDGQFHRFGVFGWVEPLFWPYAFNDVSCSVFWSYWGWGCADSHWSAGYGNPFWDYGSGDIERALFTLFAFDDLAPYLPNGVSSVHRARTREAPAGDLVAQMCGDDGAETTSWPAARIAASLTPDDAQRAALTEFINASVKAAQTVRASCPVGVAFTPGRRLDTMARRIEALQEAVATVRPALAGFYDLLSPAQKAQFAPAAPPDRSEAAREEAAVKETGKACIAASAPRDWPEVRITAMLHPTPAQETRLAALRDAVAHAAEVLAASCPGDDPATPPARLDAVARRLEAMEAAVAIVRAALEDLYGDLTDTQKAQFNRIARDGQV